MINACTGLCSNRAVAGAARTIVMFGHSIEQRDKRLKSLMKCE